MSDWFQLNPAESPYYKANLETFRKTHPLQAETIESSTERLTDYSFLKIGPQRFACRSQENKKVHIHYDPHDFYAPLKRSYDRALRFYQRGVELVLIAGAGFGYLANELEEEIRGDYTRGLLLIENRPELILAQWCLFDSRKILESNQVLWAVSEDYFLAFEDCLHEEALFQLTNERMAVVPERSMAYKERYRYKAIPMYFSSHRHDHMIEFAPKQRAFNKRMKKSPDLERGCLWGVAEPDAYAHTPLIRSLLSGFEQIGWQTQLLELKDGYSTRYRVYQDIIETAPDAVLVLNSPSDKFKINRPRIIWILDDPRHYNPETFADRFTALDTIFYSDRTYKSVFEHTNAASSQFLPVTPSITREGIYREELAAPILFVGQCEDVSIRLQTLSKKAFEETETLFSHLVDNPHLTAVEAAVKIQFSESVLNDLTQLAIEFTSRMHRTFPSRQQCLEYFIYAMANSWKRERYVKALLDRGIVVYGPESWRSVLGPKHENQYWGWLSPEDLPDAYRSAKICLNIHSLQCPTCLNCRDFDILAANGALLSDYVEDMDIGLIQTGEDFLSFTNIEELKQNAERLLEEDEKRRAIREKGHTTFLNHHTPHHRAKEIADVLRKNYNQS